MLPVKTLAQLQLADQGAQLLQDNLARAINPVLATRMLDGNLIENVELSGSSNVQVAHKLGRPWKGWFITNVDGQAAFWVASNPYPSQYLVLSVQNVSATKINLWVF